MLDNLHIIYKQVKNISIKIKPDLSIILTVPYETTQSHINKILSLKQSWINKHLAILQSNKNMRIQQPMNSIFYLGQCYVYQIIDSPINKVVIDADGMCVYASNDQYEQVIKKWLYSNASIIFSQLINNNFTYFSSLGYKIPSIYIKKMKTRWGSYSKHLHKVNLNINLLQYNLALINYVIVHELCHIIEQNHGKHFYQLMEQLLPNWNILRQELNSTNHNKI